MEAHEHNAADADLAWIGRADGTLLIPVARAPQEIDLKHLRAELHPRRPLGRHVTAIRRGRRTRTRADGTRESVFTSDALAAAANAALWMNWIYEEEGFSTGRCVSLAEDVLSPNMLIVPTRSRRRPLQRSPRRRSRDSRARARCSWVSCRGARRRPS